MAKEYIEREALLNEFDEIEPDECYDDEHDVWLDCLMSAIQAPTADVVEVKHSTWNEYYSFEKWHYDCPVCDFGFAVGIRQEEPPNYCEHCGAKMDIERSAKQ